MTKRIADSVESLGLFIKDQAKKYTLLEKQVKTTSVRASKVVTTSKPSVKTSSQATIKKNTSKSSIRNAPSTVSLKKKSSERGVYESVPQPQLRNSFEQKMEEAGEVSLNPTINNTGHFAQPQLRQEDLIEVGTDPDHQSNSPRSTFKRMRDKSLKELSESFVSAGGRSKSPSPIPDGQRVLKNGSTQSALYHETSKTPSPDRKMVNLGDIIMH